MQLMARGPASGMSLLRSPERSRMGLQVSALRLISMLEFIGITWIFKRKS